MDLLTLSNPKIKKGEAYGYRTAIMHLSPYKTKIGNKIVNVCPFSSPGCRAACLNTAGMGVFTAVQEARVRRTSLLVQNTGEFISRLSREIELFTKSAISAGFTPAVRLNGTSDLRWDLPAFGRIPQRFPSVQFYDYTKNFVWVLTNKVPNYYLLYSLSEQNYSTREAKILLSRGFNVAVVFGPEQPEEFMGYKVLSGDDSDLRFLDPPGHVIGLLEKGKAKKDTTGFVVRE